MSVLALIAAIFAPQIVRYFLASGFADDPAREQLTVHLLRIMLPSAVLFGVSGLLMGILNAHQSFFIPALAPSMYSIGIIFGVLFFAPTMGVDGLAWGVLLGASLHLLIQVPSLLKLNGRAYFPNFGLDNQAVREVLRLMGPRILGVAVVQINFWVNIQLGLLDGERQRDHPLLWLRVDADGIVDDRPIHRDSRHADLFGTSCTQPDRRYARLAGCDVTRRDLPGSAGIHRLDPPSAAHRLDAVISEESLPSSTLEMTAWASAYGSLPGWWAIPCWKFFRGHFMRFMTPKRRWSSAPSRWV